MRSDRMWTGLFLIVVSACGSDSEPQQPALEPPTMEPSSEGQDDSVEDSGPMGVDAGSSLPDASVDAAGPVDAQLTDAQPATAATLDTPVSYRADIKRIVEDHCLLCHGGATLLGGFPLTSYAEVFLERANVAAATTSLFMPPCEGAEPGTCGLSEKERSTIRRWVAQGAPEDTAK